MSTFPIRAQGQGGLEITTAPDGNLWFTLASNNIGMTNPTTQVTTQFPIPAYNSGPSAITAGPDGNLWFLEANANQIGVLNRATGAITEIPLLATANAQLQGITSGPDGNLWFTELNANQIGRINPTTHAITEYLLPTPNAQPFSITAGPDGNLWFTESGANQVGMINPATHAIQEFAVPSSGNVQAEGIAVGPDGNLWFTETAANKIGTIDPTTHAVNSYAIPTANVQPVRIARGSDNNMWFVEHTGNFGSISPVSHAVSEYSGLVFNAAPQGIVTGSDGKLWVTETNRSQLAQITPVGHSVKEYAYQATTVGKPTAIASGPDGNLWFIQPADGQVGLMNPVTHFTTQFALPQSYNTSPSITVGPDGNMWFTEDTFGVDRIGTVATGSKAIKEFALPTSNAGPRDITAGPDGNLWFTEESANQIGRITKAGAIAEFSIPTASSSPGAITAGPDGNLWFLETGVGKVGMINPTTHAVTEFALPSHGGLGANAVSIVSGPDGNLWFTENNGFQANLIDTINPTTHVIQEFPLSAIPGDLTVGPDHNLWFTYGATPILSANAVASFDPVTHTLTPLTVSKASPQAVVAGPDGNLWFTADGAFNGTTFDPNVLGLAVLAPGSTATQLAIATQPPGSVVASHGFGLVVAVKTAGGALAADFTGTVTIALSSNPGGAALGGTLTAPVSNGVAVFSGLTLNQGGTGYKIQATATGLTSATTTAFNVTLPASHLVVTTEPPATATAGAAFSLIVSAEDPNGNVDPNFAGNISLSLKSNPGGGTLSGVTLAAASAGIATFSGLSLDLAAIGYTLQASAAGLTGAVTSAITVTAAAATHLVITSQPPSVVTAGSPFGLTVSAEDGFGNVDGNFSGNVDVMIASNPVGGNLSGAASVPVTGGTATFSGLSLDKAAGGYTLQTLNPDLGSATTNPITVAAAAATHLVFTAQPPATTPAGTGFNVEVSAEDPLGNVDPSFSGNVTLALANNPGGGTLSGVATVAAGAGVASFFGLKVDQGGNGYTIQATAAGLGSATTSAFNVTLPASQLVVTMEPPLGVVAGAGFALQVSAEDALGNVDSKFTGTVTLALAANPGGSTLGGTLNVPITAGVASFDGLTLNRSGSGYTIQATSTGLSHATTNAITVTGAAATHLAVSTQPPGSVVAGTAFGVVLQALDRFGNLDPNYGGSVTVTLGSNPGGGSLGGPTTVSASAGTAAFSGLTLTRAAAGYTLKATSGALPAASSGPFAVVAAPATHLVVSTQPPTSVSLGGRFSVVASAADTFGNLATSFSGSVTIALGANPAGATLGGTLTVPTTAGAATFSNLTLNRIGRGYTLQVSVNGLTGATTSAFNVGSIPGDFDGDGKTDTAIYDQSASQFFILLSGGGAKTPQFGNPAHKNIPIAGDFDGDGKADTAIYDQTASQFFILLSGGGAKTPQFGNPAHTNIPVAGDFDGDGKADTAIYDQSTSQFFILLSGGGAKTPQFGNPAHTNIPIAGDFDGDGKADVAIYDQSASEFFILLSGGGAKTPQFGNPNDSNIPLAGDFDGDGKADVAIYDRTTSQFFILLSGGGARTPQFGNPAHKNIPAAGDYDGDGKADTAIYDQTTSQFFLLLSGGGGLTPTFGNPLHANLPLPSTYVGPGARSASFAVSGNSAPTSATRFASPATVVSEIVPLVEGSGPVDSAIWLFPGRRAGRRAL